MYYYSKNKKKKNVILLGIRRRIDFWVLRGEEGEGGRNGKLVLIGKEGETEKENGGKRVERAGDGEREGEKTGASETVRRQGEGPERWRRASAEHDDW